MESFATLIKNRRSTRKFTDQLLSPEQVEMILKAALMAPASKRKNPWQFVVVEDKEMLKKLAGCKPAGASFLEGCALAACQADRSQNHSHSGSCGCHNRQPYMQNNSCGRRGVY